MRTEKPARQHKKTIRYALDVRDGSVLMVQRARTASLMAGMWELPEVQETSSTAHLTLRHSITVTDYTVQVIRQSVPKEATGKWVPSSKVGTLPLTGLARKILRSAGII